MSKNNLTQNEFDEIKSLVDDALSAPTKKEASAYLQKLKFKASTFSGTSGNILSELCGSVSAASGQVSDKARKESFCRTDLFKLESFIARENGSNDSD